MEPEAYRIGWQPFLGLEIWLDSRPLIPRVETEWWAEQLLTKLTKPEPEGGKTGVRLGLAARSVPVFSSPGEGHLRFLDLCAGSGAIGCAALKYLPAAEVWFAELDPAHEATIKKNIEVNGLDASRPRPSGERGSPEASTPRWHVCIGDLFDALPAGRTFDVIAANPPYIPEGRALPREVADFEPALALRSGPDGLDLIHRIARELPARLNPGGLAWIECDSPSAEAARALFATEGLAATILNDQYERPRIVVARATV